MGSFGKMFRGTLGVLVAIGFMIVLGVVGCTAMLGGCVFLVGKGVESVQEAKTRAEQAGSPIVDVSNPQEPLVELSDSKQPAEPAPARPADKAPPRSRIPADLVVTKAEDLLAYFERNTLKAEADAKNKYLAVRGRVASINSDILGSPYIALSTGDFAVFSVQCFFEKGENPELLKVKAGDLVTIAGRCDGKFGNVIIRECEFYAPPPKNPQPPMAEAPRPKPAPRSVQPAEFRTWADTTGKFTVEAHLLKAGAGKVTLRKRDGKEVTLPMEKLSQADQEWIRRRAR